VRRRRHACRGGEGVAAAAARWRRRHGTTAAAETATTSPLWQWERDSVGGDDGEAGATRLTRPRRSCGHGSGMGAAGEWHRRHIGGGQRRGRCAAAAMAALLRRPGFCGGGVAFPRPNDDGCSIAVVTPRQRRSRSGVAVTMAAARPCRRGCGGVSGVTVVVARLPWQFGDRAAAAAACHCRGSTHAAPAAAATRLRNGRAVAALGAQQRHGRSSGESVAADRR